MRAPILFAIIYIKISQLFDIIFYMKNINNYKLNNILCIVNILVKCAIALMVFVFIIYINAYTYAVEYGYNKAEGLITYANETIELINNYRMENGVTLLKPNDTLMLVADIRANEITNDFSSTRPDGTTTQDLLKAYGYFNSMNSPAINMASGVEDPYRLIEAWSERQDSRELLLSNIMEEIGVGVTRKDGIYYWYCIMYSQNLNDNNKMILESILPTIVNNNMTDYEKIKAVHDYICLFLDYDYTYQYRSVTDVLDHRTAVCHGYANLFKAFMDLLGIQNEFVVGHANGEIVDPSFTEYINHSWNTVTLNGVTYHIDTTWDDLTKEYNIINYECFMVDKTTIDKIHESAKLVVTDNYGTITAKYEF